MPENMYAKLLLIIRMRQSVYDGGDDNDDAAASDG
jgi:hypothetical protein